MEVFAGFTEHADVNAGKVIDEIERQGRLDNTLIFYIWGDNGSSSEGLNGTISEQLAQNGIPTTISQHIEALEGARRPGCAGRPEDRQHVPRRLGLGRQHAVPGHQADGRLLRRHAPADGRGLAQAHQGRRDAAAAVPPRDRHRADDLRADEDHAAARRQRLRAGPDPRRQHGLHASATPRRRARARRSSSTSWPAAASTTTAGSPARRARASPGSAASQGHQGMVAADRQVGAVPPRPGLEPGQGPRRSEPEEARGDEGAVHRRIDEEQEPADRRRPVVDRAVPSGGCAGLAADRMDLRLPHHAHAGIRGAQARQEQQPASRWRWTCRPTPTACSMRWPAFPAASPPT